MKKDNNPNDASHDEVFGHLTHEHFNRYDACLYLDVDDHGLSLLLLKADLADDQRALDIATLRRIKALQFKKNPQD
jgi:hypothetical protein